MTRDTQQLARVALQFLARTDLKGAELRGFLAVVDWLEDLAADRPAEQNYALDTADKD